MKGNARIALGAGFILLLAAGLAAVERLAGLPQVMKPFFVTAGEGRLYVVEETAKVHIYRLQGKGVVFEKTFGREGQGPGEFGFIHQLRVCKDHLEIPTAGKFARFTLDGEFIDEIKLTVKVFKNSIWRSGVNWLARSYDLDGEGRTSALRLYDKEFKLLKEIGVRREKSSGFQIAVVSNYYGGRVDGERIYVVDSAEKTQVEILDSSGRQLQAFPLPLPPQPVTAEMKERLLRPFKEDPEFRSQFDQLAKRLTFPERTPGLDYFAVADGRLIARTFNYKGDLVEFVIFDDRGRERQRAWLPDTGRTSQGVPFCFFNGRFFVLRENPDQETWELLGEKIWDPPGRKVIER